jgi:hypothetical protein
LRKSRLDNRLGFAIVTFAYFDSNRDYERSRLTRSRLHV